MLLTTLAKIPCNPTRSTQYQAIPDQVRALADVPGTNGGSIRPPDCGYHDIIIPGGDGQQTTDWLKYK